MPPPASSSIKLLPLGASLQELLLPVSSSEKPLNLVLGFTSPSTYSNNPNYFGATIGRYANRITNAHLSLNSTTYTLSSNNGSHCLHGGSVGWDQKTWSGPTYGLNSDGVEAAEFRLTSPDGDQGFPGEVEAVARYSAEKVIGAAGRRKVRVTIDYEAKLIGGAESTVINMTNHSYFNLNPSSPTIAGTVGHLGSSIKLPLDSTGVPIPGVAPANMKDVEGRFTLGSEAPVVDDCFIFPDVTPGDMPLDTRLGDLRVCGRFWHPETKVHLVVESTEPSFQFYTGGFVGCQDGEGGRVFQKRGGFCIEPCRYVDAASREEWREQVVVRQGETWGSRIVYTVWEGEEDEM